MMMIAVTVTGKDRPGIIAELTGAIFKSKGNLEDASMTILEGEFAMILLADLKTKSAAAVLRERLDQIRRQYHLSIAVRPILRRVKRGEKHLRGTEPWVASVLGKDRAGIVFRVCQVLASSGLNITDLNSKIMGHGRKATYALVLEVDVPRKPALTDCVKRRFQTLEKQLRVKITFHLLGTAYL